MIINHNIAALNTHRQLSSNSNAVQGSLEKLSSGLAINKAGDDAAGLAISEKMRGQIRGLEMAQKNAQDGISLIQTAEGALNETHAILQRMRELAVQSSNDTNTETDRAELQKEVDQLSEELSRIGNTTEFNTQNLLNGKFEGTFHIGANEQQNLKININDMRGNKLGVTGNAKFEETVSVTETGAADLKDGIYKVDGTDLKDADGNVVATTTDQLTWTASVGETDDTFVFTQEIDSGTIKIANGEATAVSEFENGGLQAGTYTANATTLKDSNGNTIATSTDGTTFTGLDGKTTLLTVDTALTADTTISVGGIDVSSQSAADSAITTIQSAIDTVSAERSKLGAYQNRLDHTINNLGTSAENLTAAESRIRDVDMAKEMMEFTKNNILSQAAQSMLAQANQQPQGVLQLLR
ncbi:flagellin [Virgibacillus indicus]|uniref:Flagellin n=1 Tax=Virgibacillus indicus TaxID=2024554 RepID=A0A265N9S3_9BACI|nr:flagellin [Virgibacillus indicus]OZU88224.1 flagellin [Virgibacillus indicus]